ncbi:hypothetical protein SPFM15_00095 [Salmonella phage SPFM15]|nr:hypothetical protein SPFM5_00090 [Salmonella phage SPFM5]VFR13719.1 hypothetical protein SPFM15_00095 [Salmonella phage SPFM15]
MTKYGRQLLFVADLRLGTSELKQWHYDAIIKWGVNKMRSVAEPAYLMSAKAVRDAWVSGTLQRVNSSVVSRLPDSDTAWVFDCRPTNTISPAFWIHIQSEILLSIYKRKTPASENDEKGDVVNEKVVTLLNVFREVDVWSVMPITEPGNLKDYYKVTMFWTSDENANHYFGEMLDAIDEDTKEALRDLVTIANDGKVSKRRFYTKNAPREAAKPVELVQQFPEFTAYQITTVWNRAGFNEKLQNFNSERLDVDAEVTPDMPALSDSNWWTGGELNTNTMWVHYILTLLTGKPVFELDSRVAYLSGNQNIGRAIAEGLGHHVSDLAPWVELTMTFEGQKLSTVVEKRLLDKGEVKCRFSIRSMAYSDVTWQDCAYLPPKEAFFNAVITNSIVLLGMHFSVL